jgi:PAS domain S-box-containing protein
VEELELDAGTQHEFKTLAENAPDMIARLDREQRYLYVNPVVEAATGIPAERFRGQTNRDLGMTEGFCSLWERQVGAVLETGDALRFDFGAPGPDGERHYEARLVPEFGQDGSIRSVLAVVRDITDRERTRRILSRYASRLHFMQQVSQAIRAAYSAETAAEAVLPYTDQLLSCSRASVALYDRQAGEACLLAVRTETETVLGKGERIPLDWDWYLDALARGEMASIDDLAAAKPATGVLPTLYAEGVRRLISVPLMVQDELIGSLNLGMATLRRLTAEQEEIARDMANQLGIAIHQARLHEQVELYAQGLEQSVARRTAALQASQARFRTIFENSAIGIALVESSEQVVVASNPALQEMLGYSAEELQGMKVSQFTHPDDLEARDALFDELMAGKRSQFRLERRYIRKDGTTIWVHPTVSAVRTAQGTTPYAIKMVEDVTEQRNAREALVQAERLTITGQLGASLAHEINNPLQSVIGSLGLADEMVDPDDPVHPFLQLALEELERAAGIVAQLRDLNRRSQPEERRSTQLNELAEKVLLLSQHQFETRQIEIRWSPADDLPEISVVPDRIRQVFLNLVLNAIEAMPQGGRLEVRTGLSSHPRGVQCVFADTGPGIAAELQPHLFEPFQSTRAEGLGLGLYVSKTIVDEHGGRIDVDSQEGRGATFTVWLPAE